MKYLKSINELIKNKISLRSILNKELVSLNNRLSYKIKKDNIKSEIRSEYYRIEFLHTTEKDHPIWINWLRNIKSKLSKEDIIASYKDYKRKEQRLVGDDFEMEDTGNIVYDYILYLKNKHTKRIKPNKYVYHYSKPKYRNDILKYGIKAKSHESSEDWGNMKFLEYPNAVFAVNSNDPWREGDKWKIDTTKIKNIWWEDLNFSNRPDMIMTFSDIPKESIILEN